MRVCMSHSFSVKEMKLIRVQEPHLLRIGFPDSICGSRHNWRDRKKKEMSIGSLQETHTI